MRVAVRKRMGVRTKMRTRAVKRAWWTRTRMQRRRVKWRSVCSHVCMEGHAGNSGNELCFWGGRVHQNTPTMSALWDLEEPQGCCSALWGAAAPQQCASSARSLCCDSGAMEVMFPMPPSLTFSSVSSCEFPG